MYYPYSNPTVKYFPDYSTTSILLLNTEYVSLGQRLAHGVSHCSYGPDLNSLFGTTNNSS